MSFKMFCDKCGAEIDNQNVCEKHRERDLDIAIGYWEPRTYNNRILEAKHYIDLCDACRKKLENVIRRNLAECLPAPRKRTCNSGKDEK